MNKQKIFSELSLGTKSACFGIIEEMKQKLVSVQYEIEHLKRVISQIQEIFEKHGLTIDRIWECDNFVKGAGESFPDSAKFGIDFKYLKDFSLLADCRQAEKDLASELKKLDGFPEWQITIPMGPKGYDSGKHRMSYSINFFRMNYGIRGQKLADDLKIGESRTIRFSEYK